MTAIFSHSRIKIATKRNFEYRKLMNIKLYATIFINLVFGNIILYIHETFGRHQTELELGLYVWFSIASVLLFLLSLKILKSRPSRTLTLLICLCYSFLVPALGFFAAMNFSPVSLMMISAYLFYGFLILVLPMFVLNYFLFRWSLHLQKN